MLFFKKYTSTIASILGIISAVLAITFNYKGIYTKYLTIPYIVIIACFGYIYLRYRKEEKHKK